MEIRLSLWWLFVLCILYNYNHYECHMSKAIRIRKRRLCHRSQGVYSDRVRALLQHPSFCVLAPYSMINRPLYLSASHHRPNAFKKTCLNNACLQPLITYYAAAGIHCPWHHPHPSQTHRPMSLLRLKAPTLPLHLQDIPAALQQR